MEKFTTLTGIGAPLLMDNIDTDQIIPKQFLKTVKRTGLKEGLLYDFRFDENDQPRPDFVLNREPFSHAKILVAGDNFGCGSSREHAPWALLDFGIRCVIAMNFADIFYNNCFKNGLLPAKLPQEHVSAIAAHAEAGEEITVDLPEQVVKTSLGAFPFIIEPFRKKCLLEGLDEVGLTMQKMDTITTFEEKQKAERGWLSGK